MPITLHEMAFGTEKLVSFSHQGQVEKISVKIPAGTLPGKRLRIHRQGQPQSHWGPPRRPLCQTERGGAPGLQTGGQ